MCSCIFVQVFSLGLIDCSLVTKGRGLALAQAMTSQQTGTWRLWVLLLSVLSAHIPPQAIHGLLEAFQRLCMDLFARHRTWLRKVPIDESPEQLCSTVEAQLVGQSHHTAPWFLCPCPGSLFWQKE